MDAFFIDCPIQKASFSLKHGDGIVLQGSCFSDEMLVKFSETGHHVSGNEFGTIFHPSMIAHNLLNLFAESSHERILQRDDLFLSYDASSSIVAYSEEELKNKLVNTRLKMKENISNAKLLMVTFGTAWGYELAETDELVANCHKQPSSLFNKFLSSPYEMVQDWILTIEKLRILNPELQIVFTVSPVRHIRDGIVGNNLSKARLLEVVHQLVLEPNCHYFPSYELLIDVLRDYRFYASDKVHPSSEAVQFIWEKLEHTYFSEDTMHLNKEVKALKEAEQHRGLFPESEGFKKHQAITKEKITKLVRDFPQIKW